MKRVLLIDDADQSSTLENINRTYRGNEPLSTAWFNPVDNTYYSEENLNIEKSLRELTTRHLSDKIDVIGCDFNLDQKDKTLVFKIIKEIRNNDKCATIFIYSGGINKYLFEFFKGQGDYEGERLIREVLASDIRRIVNGRAGVLKENVIELIEKPNVLLQILNFIEDKPELTVENKYLEFKNLTLGEIAKEIKCQSPKGILFSQRIIETALSNLVDLSQ